MPWHRMVLDWMDYSSGRGRPAGFIQKPPALKFGFSTVIISRLHPVSSLYFKHHPLLLSISHKYQWLKEMDVQEKESRGSFEIDPRHSKHPHSHTSPINDAERYLETEAIRLHSLLFNSIFQMQSRGSQQQSQGQPNFNIWSIPCLDGPACGIAEIDLAEFLTTTLHSLKRERTNSTQLPSAASN